MPGRVIGMRTRLGSLANRSAVATPSLRAYPDLWLLAKTLDESLPDDRPSASGLSRRSLLTGSGLIVIGIAAIFTARWWLPASSPSAQTVPLTTAQIGAIAAVLIGLLIVMHSLSNSQYSAVYRVVMLCS